MPVSRARCLLAACLVVGCAAVRDDLARAEALYDEARYEAAFTWLDVLDRDVPDMDAPMRARFHYLRGMTAYRLGDRRQALHHLALTRELLRDAGPVLRPRWQENLQRTLEDLGAAERPGVAARRRSPEWPASGDEKP